MLDSVALSTPLLCSVSSLLSFLPSWQIEVCCRHLVLIFLGFFQIP